MKILVSISLFQNITDPAYTACCKPCSCTSDCVKADNCCPDAPVNHEEADTCQCITANENLNNKRGMSTAVPMSGPYRIVDTCPSDTNSTIAKRCTVKRALTDYMFVTSMHIYTVYANRHCALCNGKTDFLPWKLFSKYCPGLFSMTFQTFQERDDYIIDNCTLDAVPPADIPKQTFSCHQRRIDTCNMTGKWDKYDPFIEHACLDASNSDIYENTDSLLPKLFSNVFCFMCNLQSKDAIPGMCNIAMLNGIFNKAPQSYVTFLELTGMSPDSLNTCKTYEIQNPFTVSNTPSVC